MSLLLTLFVSGCASNSGGSGDSGGSSSGGSRTLKQVDSDVSGKMMRFNNAVALGTVTPGEQQQVNSVYTQYRAAYRQALQAAGNNSNALALDSVTSLANQIIGAVASIP